MDVNTNDLSLESVRVMRLQPGDTIVIKSAYRISQEVAEHLKRELETRYSGYRVLVLDQGIDIEVVRKSE
jgi:Rad3-related DNA helicase